MLQTNEFVLVVYMDLTKAFDTVRHSSLMLKLGSLEIPDHAYNWLVNYFLNRGHVTGFWGVISEAAAINASVIQGSVVGPASFAVGVSDLHPKHKSNRMVKFADDTYLLVGSSNITTVGEEVEHISAWAMGNNLKLNPSRPLKPKRCLYHGCVSSSHLNHR